MPGNFAPDPLRPGAARPTRVKAAPERPLTVREARFVQEYLVDLNARAAARRAGYKWPSGTPGKLLQRPGVRAALLASMDEDARRLGITRAKVMEEWAAIAFSSLRDVAAWGHRDGVPFLDITPSHALPEGVAGAVAEVVSSRRGLRIRLHDKVAALTALSRHLGFLQAWREEPVTQPDAPQQVIMAQLVEWVSKLSPELRARTQAILVDIEAEVAAAAAARA